MRVPLSISPVVEPHRWASRATPSTESLRWQALLQKRYLFPRVKLHGCMMCKTCELMVQKCVEREDYGAKVDDIWAKPLDFVSEPSRRLSLVALYFS